MTSVVDSNSQTATISTEHTLTTWTAPGVFVLTVDMANLTGSDSVELRIYGKARTGDTERLLLKATYGPGAPLVTPLIQSTPVVSPHYLKATLKQVAGTGRVFPWGLYEV